MAKEKSKQTRRPTETPLKWLQFTGALTLFFLFCIPVMKCFAADAPPPQDPNQSTNPQQAPDGVSANPAPEEKTKLPDPDDYTTTPFTSYGEFNQQGQEEENDIRFFQFGRLFGVSIGLGLEAVDGNRGLLWQGGFPLIDFKVHYWFDFNLALNIGIYTANHNFTVPGTGQVNVSMIRGGLDLKYYLNTKNLSSAITFASPYFLLGVGSFTKSEYTPLIGSIPTTLQSLGVSAGMGLEFTLAPRMSYIEFEGKINYVPFYDSGSTAYLASKNIPNLNGNFWTFSSSLLLTW
jgi:hypothetical protein